MAPKIHTSLSPNVALPRCSMFSLVFGTPDRHRPEQPVFTDAATGYTINRSELHDLALRLAYGFTHVKPTGLGKRGLPLRPGSGQVALMFAPNCFAFPPIFYGLQAAGVITTLANASYNPRELAHQLHDSNAEVAFVHSTLLPVLNAAWKELGVSLEHAKRRTVILDWEPWKTTTQPVPGYTMAHDLASLGKLPHEVYVTGEQVHQTALMCYSSGTTGLAKGVETTHHNATSLVAIHKGALPFTGDDVALCILPLYHIFGCIFTLLYWPAFGVPAVISSGPFSPDSFCSSVVRYKITRASVVPPILLALAKHPAIEKYDLSSLRDLMSGAAPLSDSLADAVVTRLTRLGAKEIYVTQGYGLTETSPTVFYQTSGPESRKRVGSVGRLLPNLEVRLVVDGPGEVDAAPGEPGEIWVRGPNVMKGYLNNPKANAEVLTKDGFFKTGDIAIHDAEGYFTIVDRKKELIKYKGFQVPPAEIEALLITHPDIVDAAVIGVYSKEQETELPRAYIVHREGLPKLADKAKFESEIVKWVAARVAKHKQLRGGVSVIDIIPKSAAGKILRRELRERVKAETGLDPVTGKPVKAHAKL